jgi:PleD family two-component response regulator
LPSVRPIARPGTQFAASTSIYSIRYRASLYTSVMSTTAAPVQHAREVRILVLDDDIQSQGALRQILDSEGWRVRIVPDTKLLLTE